MSHRHIRLLLVLGAFLAGLVACFGIILLASGRLSAPPGVQSTAAIGGPFILTDQNGNTVTDREFRGRPFLVFFGFTHCPDICPTTLFEVSEIMRALGRDASKVGAAFITIDPERDTPAVLKDYLASFDPRLKALTGDLSTITSVAKAYRVYFKKVPLDKGSGAYTMDHTAIVYLMDKEGRFVAPFSLKRSANVAAEELRKHI